ncbi:hypothetical protein BT69DRAFT_1348290 [Atractiella rhizophila]|nr:hypothetical protein BT69DRAFT_1348290 [Atractiella rhizophila]
MSLATLEGTIGKPPHIRVSDFESRGKRERPHPLSLREKENWESLVKCGSEHLAVALGQQDWEKDEVGKVGCLMEDVMMEKVEKERAAQVEEAAKNSLVVPADSRNRKSFVDAAKATQRLQQIVQKWEDSDEDGDSATSSTGSGVGAVIDDYFDEWVRKNRLCSVFSDDSEDETCPSPCSSSGRWEVLNTNIINTDRKLGGYFTKATSMLRR